MTDRRNTILERLAAGLVAANGVDGVFLHGSLARGDADAVSDIDLVAVASADASDDVVAAFRAALADGDDVVMFRASRGLPRLVNAITADWVRADLLVLDAETFLRRPAADLRPLDDPHGYYGQLVPDRVAPPVLGPLAFLIEEFLRVRGLLPVVVARGEWIAAVSGWSLQRESLIRLMRLESGARDTGGVLHLSRILPPEDIALLEALPSPRAERSEILAAHEALARVFLPRARALAKAEGVPWPEAFAAATEAHVARAVTKSGA